LLLCKYLSFNVWQTAPSDVAFLDEGKWHVCVARLTASHLICLSTLMLHRVSRQQQLQLLHLRQLCWVKPVLFHSVRVPSSVCLSLCVSAQKLKNRNWSKLVRIRVTVNVIVICLYESVDDKTYRLVIVTASLIQSYSRSACRHQLHYCISRKCQ